MYKYERFQHQLLCLYLYTGSHQRLEFEIRCFFRRVFLDHCSSLQDRAFWLTRILKPWPLVYQARLLFLLYGPVLSGNGRFRNL